MSNGSAELPQNAIRRMISTVETIQSLFPDLWVDADTDDPQESSSSGNTGPTTQDCSWNHVEEPQYKEVCRKQSTRSHFSWPCGRAKDNVAPENPNAAISRLMSTAATNQLLFPEFWDPVEKVEQDFSTDRFQVAYGSPGIWSHNQQKQIQQPSKNQQDTPDLLARLERVDRSEDEDSSDSGICSGTYLA